MNKLKKEKGKAELGQLRYEMAERRANKSEISEHNNTVHENEQKRNNRAKAKAKNGPSRPEHNADHRNDQTPDTPNPPTKSFTD